ncbi:MAG: ABC transporter substrate-binding protein, partial [Ilumatobacteraceae bacterium]
PTGGAPATTAGGPTPDTAAPTTEAPATGWAVDTSVCTDEAAATAPIEGTLKIGSAMPLTGGAAAAAFAPVKDGFEAYIQYANEKGLVPGVTLEVSIEDDQYNAELTPGAVDKQISAGANIFAGIIGTANNLAVRDTLNDNCIPQLAALTGAPTWGDVENYPWTTGQLAPYDVETKVYAQQISELYPDGANVALFHVNNEFGQFYVDTFREVAADYNFTEVEEETIEATDQAPPTAQLTNIAAAKPDVIMAVPLGAQCISFLTEVANQKAANPGWNPAVFVTNTCASSLILQLAGAAADGLYTSSNLVDVVDPANAALPGVKEYIDFMTSIGKQDIVATAAAGWTTAETVVAVLAQAAASPEGLTRASIVNAARNFEHTPMLGVPGVTFKMNGAEDAYVAQSLVVRQYKFDPTTPTFVDISDLITEYES